MGEASRCQWGHPKGEPWDQHSEESTPMTYQKALQVRDTLRKIRKKKENGKKKPQGRRRRGGL